MRSPTIQSRRSQQGMALIEALVSVLIFSFGVLGLIGLQASAVNFSADAEDRTRAALLANEITSGMWLTHTVTVSAAQLAIWQAAITDRTNPLFLVNGTLSVTPTAGTTNSADIAIGWRAPTDKAADPNRQFTTRVILP